MQTIVTTLILSLALAQSSGQVKKTDREYDELNGAVRFVRVEVEDRDESGASKTNTRFFEKIVAYDVHGRLTEEIHGSGKGCVSSRHVFSYDAGGSRTEAIYPGTAPVAGDKSDPSQPAASFLIHKQVFKMDGAGRRSELDEYDNTGKLSGKSFYKYDDQGRIDLIVQENDSTRSRCEFKYNDKGLASEKKCQYSDSSRSDRWRYAYDYDANGNWIKRIAKFSSVEPNHSFFEHIRIRYRELRYYASKTDQSQQEEMGDRFDATKLAPCQPTIIRRTGRAFQDRATRRVIPRYPPDAKAARIRGSVVVEVTVDETGKVIAVRSISGPAELRGASEEAARGWQFREFTLFPPPVRVIGTITFIFNL